MEFVYYYSISFAVFFVAGLSRCVRNGDYHSPFHSVSVGMVSAFLGLAITSIAFGVPEEDQYGYSLGIGVLVSLAGRELTDNAIVKTLAKLGLITDEQRNKICDKRNSS